MPAFPRRLASACALLAVAIVGSAAAAQTGEGRAPPPELSAIEADIPPVVLHGVPFRVTLRRPAADPSAEDDPAGPTPVAFRLVDATGRVMAAGRLAPGEERVLEELEVAGGDELPLALELAAVDPAADPDEAAADTGDDAADEAAAPPPGAAQETRTLAPLHLAGWLSLLPPLVAIALALIFREVVLSLFLGVWTGALLYAGWDPGAAVWRSIDRFIVPALADADHAAIIVFSLLLGGMVGVISRSGGTRGIVEAVRPIATSPRRSQFATYLAGLAIFFDDYANTLIVGNTMRPITDRMKVSREKLAYIVDSTAAPIAAIVFVSTWVGFEISLIGDGLVSAAGQPGTSPEVAADLLAANPFTVFIHSIPYLFYPILALAMVALIIVLQRDFGPMWDAENRASRGDGLYREGAMLMTDTSGGEMEPIEGAPERWYNAALPVITVILVVLLGLYFDGRASVGPDAALMDIFGAANPFDALLWGSLAGCIVGIALAVGQRILSVQQSVDAWLGGMRAMMLAAVILVLAWSLQEVTEVLATAPYLSGLLSESLPPFLLPVLVFLTSAVIAFSTGTSWGTMAILLPIVIPLAVSLGGGIGFEGGARYTILLGSISSVLAGAIWGDHCSPISDTTVMSSLGSACDHMDHVRTQLPYALLVGFVAMLVGDIATALGVSPLISYAVGITILFLVVRYVGRPDHASPQWEG